MPTVPLPAPRVPATGGVDAPRPVSVRVDDVELDLAVCQVGLACCALEAGAALAEAAGGALPEAPHTDGAAASPSGRHTVLVVAGTVTNRMAHLVRGLYDELPEPRHVLSFGVCSNTGGPYWDSYAVTNGIEQLMPVDVHVPGCPPPPEALLDGLRLLARRVAGEGVA